MKKSVLYISLMIGVMIQIGCNNSSTSIGDAIALDSCNIEVNDVKFNKSINLTNSQITQVNDTLIIKAGSKTDLFCDPSNITTNATAPMLITTIDNTKPFTFTVKVTPNFTDTGTYSAGGIIAFIDNKHWQKLCYEQDEDGNHRVVTVRTINVSDDNNHDKINLSSVYLRMSSDTKVIGSYYSEDGINWHLARIYKNEYPSNLGLSISAQSPTDASHTCKFSNIELSPKAVRNFRKGNM